MICDLADNWLAETLKGIGCDDIGQLNIGKCKAPLKDDIASLLHGALVYMSKQSVLIRGMLSTASELKDEVIESQRSVVKLQEQLLESKDEQLQALQTAVTSSVHESVKAEFKSYSSAVEKGTVQSQSVTPLTSATLKWVVKEVVEEEDRSRNIMVFGLVEETDELLGAKVSDVFQTVGEKPRPVEVCRVGTKDADKPKRARPVKVTLSSSVTVSHILSKSRNLRYSEKYKTVFLSADRSFDQRSKHRLLVSELKKKADDEPERKHFIRNDKVCSVDKPV